MPCTAKPLSARACCRYAFARAHDTHDFVKLLSELARDARAPLTLLGRLRTDEHGRVDLKKGGLMPMFTAARVLAIRHAVDARSTPERYAGLRAKGIGAPDDIAAIIDAHQVILTAMLRQQITDAERGVPLSPRVEAARLTRDERKDLLAALGQVATVVDLVAEGRMS